MPSVRDPLSVTMDTRVSRVLRNAARQTPTATEVFITSPPREFRQLDYGGRTAHERAFTRSVYYQVFRLPRIFGVPPAWSAKLTWGPIRRTAGGRWGRPCRVRLFRAGSGERYVQGIMRRDPWAEDVLALGDWRAGTRRSVPGDRIDSNREAAG